MRIAPAFLAVPLLCGCARACGLESEYFLEDAGGPAAPVVHFPLDEGEGTVAHDVVSGLEGVVKGAAEWRPDGVIAGALEFDGVTGHVDLRVHELFDFGPDDFSIALWLRYPSAAMSNENSWTVVQHGNVNEAYYRLSFNHSPANGRRLFFEIGDGIVARNTPLVCKFYFDDKYDQWFAVAVVRQGAVLTVYLNGTVWSQTDIGALDASTTHDTALAQSPGNLSPFPGRLDDVRFYDVALTAEEIAALYLEVEEPWQPPSCNE
ncbi:MAG TPA: LamG domain-containing protein [Polyangiaceae bacterium]|nr:LamG domain-containing protein [Polyangiaceae bacterium]